MVGVGPTPQDHSSSALARVSLVDFSGAQIYDSYVLPLEPVTDYRTFVSGITRELLETARPLSQVQGEVGTLLEGRILVGHAIRNDLEVLMLGHPRRDIRDTSRYAGYRKLMNGRTPGLKRLAKEVLGLEIQTGQHSSVEDARTTMALFRKEKDGFEREIRRMYGAEKGAANDGEDVGKVGGKGVGIVSTKPEERRERQRKKKKKGRK